MIAWMDKAVQSSGEDRSCGFACSVDEEHQVQQDPFTIKAGCLVVTLDELRDNLKSVDLGCQPPLYLGFRAVTVVDFLTDDVSWNHKACYRLRETVEDRIETKIDGKIMWLDGCAYLRHPILILAFFETAKGLPEAQVADDVKQRDFQPVHRIHRDLTFVQEFTLVCQRRSTRAAG
jgi:hypothetical protein